MPIETATRYHGSTPGGVRSTRDDDDAFELSEHTDPRTGLKVVSRTRKGFPRRVEGKLRLDQARRRLQHLDR